MINFSKKFNQNTFQQRLATKKEVKYSYGSYNKFNETEQWIRITEGCPHNCPFCYEPKKIKIFDIPDIVRNDVKIMDMNILCKKESLNIIKELGKKRVNEKVIHYELVCGIDYRFLTDEIAKALKRSRFKKIRIAWDWFYRCQFEIKDAIQKLLNAGYRPNDIMVFMVCNWKMPFEENMKKLDLCKIWGVQVADCYYDNQVFPNVISIFWTDKENKAFRKKCRKHNQLVNFGIDPEVK